METETEGNDPQPPSEYDFSSDFYFPLPDQPGEIYETEEQDFYVQTVVEGISVPWGMVFCLMEHADYRAERRPLAGS
jgi:hypothetical protein